MQRKSTASLNGINLRHRISDLEPYVMPPMDDSQAVDLIIALGDSLDIAFEADEITYLVSLIKGGFPYFGQIIFRAIRDAKPVSVDLARLKIIIRDMADGDSHDLNHYHSRLDDYMTGKPLHRSCADLILNNTCALDSISEEELYDTYFYEKYDHEIFRSVLARLINEGYLTRDYENFGKITFVAPLLQYWWKLKKGL